MTPYYQRHEPDVRAPQWEKQWCVVDNEDWPCAVERRRRMGDGMSSTDPEPLDVDTLTGWLIEDMKAERATRQGNYASRELVRFLAMRLLTRLRQVPPPGFVKATTIESLTKALADCVETVQAARQYRDAVMVGASQPDQLERWAVLDEALNATR